MGQHRIKYTSIINDMLMTQRSSDDVILSLTLPEHKFKKHSEKLNWVLKEIYKLYQTNGIKMFHLVLSLQDYFDVVWLKENILDNEVLSIVQTEMTAEYDINIKKKTVKNNKK